MLTDIHSISYINAFIFTDIYKAPLTGWQRCGIASTGSGKSLAFLIPGLLKITKDQANNSNNNYSSSSSSNNKSSNPPRPSLLVLAPTR